MPFAGNIYMAHKSKSTNGFTVVSASARALSTKKTEWAMLLLYVAWLTSVISAGGSMFFSEVMHFPPCVLCWYQRIAMFPLVAIFSVAIFYEDTKVDRYAWPFVVFGLGTAVYHNLVYFHWIAETMSPCAQGISCASRQLELFGLTIPLLSLFAFVLIGGVLVLKSVMEKRKQ